jgi:hypothetical protein
VFENGCRLRRRPQNTTTRAYQFAVQESIPVTDSGASGRRGQGAFRPKDASEGSGTALLGIRKIAASCSTVRMGFT